MMPCSHPTVARSVAPLDSNQSKTSTPPPDGHMPSELVQLTGHRFQNPWDGMRNARLKREDAFSHAMIIVSSAMVSSS